MRYSVILILVLLISATWTNCTKAGDTSSGNDEIQIAKMYYDHGLNDKAKDKMLALTINKSTPDSVKAEALYWLGQITFEEGRYTTALSDWQILTGKYPDTSPAKDIATRLKQLRDIIGQATDKTVSSLTAQAYIQNGDFWSKTTEKFTIDHSWLPNVELASSWYDRVIAEFPKSKDAENAYRKKMFTLLGWKGIGEYAPSYGVEGDPKKYIPILVDCFNKFQSDFPESTYLQGFRYQIGQAYWGRKNWEQARSWFQSVIDNAGGGTSFYSETAKARLEKLQW